MITLLAATAIRNIPFGPTRFRAANGGRERRTKVKATIIGIPQVGLTGSPSCSLWGII
jgi:hypothetical protein